MPIAVSGRDGPRRAHVDGVRAMVMMVRVAEGQRANYVDRETDRRDDDFFEALYGAEVK